MSVNLTKSFAHSGIPPLSRPEKALLGGACLLGVGVGTLGLASSFGSVAGAAEQWGFGQPWMLPIGIDLAIPVFTAANLLLIRLNMPTAWVRWVPWALTLVTCWLNIAAGHSVSAKLAHGAMPLLWVALSEIAAHVYAVRIGIATGQRMEKIRRSRWLLAPISSFALWRRMTLWEITSYDEALLRERERLLARARLREMHGRGWRRKAPRRTRVLLKLGEVAVDEPADAPTPQKQEEPPRKPKPTPSTGRGRAKRRGKPHGRVSFDEHLARARELTADWAVHELGAEPLRKALGCGQERSRALRDALRAERGEASDELVGAAS